MVCGLTGSGKTYFIINKILPELDKKLDPSWQFKANCHVNDDFLSRKVEYFTDFKDIYNFKKCVVIVDDAGIWFGARQWNKFPIELQDVIINNRKNGLKMWLSTQFLENVDRTIRDNLHEYWECEKKFGTDENAQNPFGLIVARRYRPRQYDKVRRNALKSRWVWITKNGASRYDTYEIIKRPPENKKELRQRIKEQKVENATVEALTEKQKRRGRPRKILQNE